MDEQDFESALRSLILKAFANGEAVDGVWEIENVPDEIPDWTITVQRATDQLESQQSVEQIDEQIV